MKAAKFGRMVLANDRYALLIVLQGKRKLLVEARSQLQQE
jgi:hypothetical protein